jgi:hypothetical protein
LKKKSVSLLSIASIRNLPTQVLTDLEAKSIYRRLPLQIKCLAKQLPLKKISLILMSKNFVPTSIEYLGILSIRESLYRK